MSSVNGVGQDLYQLFQNFAANQQSQPAATAGPSSTASSPQPDADGQQAAEGTHGHHHHHGQGGFFQQIQTAVTEALQSAQSDGSVDPNQVVQDAIEQVLQNHGAGATQTSDNGIAASQNTASVAAAPTDQDPSASRQAFMQLLQANGIDPQQFHKDFMAAIQQAQDGQVDPSTAFQSFPPGSSVDTTV